MELLAPAGNFDCLIAAVQNGADAVYFAGKSFGARSYANNFELPELEKALDYCHLRGCKAYITVNTLVLDKEFETVAEYLRFLTKAGADAVIVQDMGIVSLIRDICPELPIHASTQMSVHNAAGVKELEKLGIKRSVLARELSKENIIEIANNVNTELEVFVHGAMCMSYSGQCLMSSMLGGRSGNRGKCAQPCRLPYRINKSQDTKFYLSLKDMSLLSHLAELKNIGVSSLKLEGRMKGAAYVAATVQTYRRYLDSGKSPTKEDWELLNNVFFRGGYSDGYFTGRTGRQMFAFDKPDNPYRKGNAETTKELTKTFVNTENIRHRVKGHLTLAPGKLPKICWECENISISYVGTEFVQMALQRPLTQEFVQIQMMKTGGTVFEIEELIVELAPNCFLTAKALNELRRESLNQLQIQLISLFKRKVLEREIDFNKKNSFLQKADSENEYAQYRCSIMNIEQFNVVKLFLFDKIGVPLSMVIKKYDELKDEKERIILIPPAILREEEWKTCQRNLQQAWNLGFRSLYVQNISMIDTVLPYHKYGNFRLNVFNRQSADFFIKKGCKSVMLSPELNLSQMRDITSFYPTESIVYGHLPIMISENCVVRNVGACPCDKANRMIDRMGIAFPVVKDDDICRSVILNAKPVYMADKKDDLHRFDIKISHLMFSIENKSECMAICSDYFGQCDSPSLNDFTRAHFYKGV